MRAQDDETAPRHRFYRNLNLLADAGEILSIKTPGGSRFDRIDRAAGAYHLRDLVQLAASSIVTTPLQMP
ncbi:MAG: hypothetical protein ACLTHL_09470 [Collinsella sp.]